MDLNEYQYKAKQTAIYPKDCGVIYCLLGLGNEAGELQGKYKKFLRDGTDWETVRTQLLAELGDVLWYVAMAAEELDCSMVNLAQMNLEKLNSRQQRGTLGGSGDDR